ncbi:hypothetical protein ACFSE0_07505 [Ochrobactrum teleogrylli]|uniref:Rap1a immunity protein domain-containing protein n=1 Tax=Ochrobactrum teleogrylli TaxID=2479765 RepID=A0ABY2Y1P3_9HYPH|nr:hypothetical protein [[Ochrobactrum] teleogrylli]TNV13237.1 hypothetical protein FIC94_15990 [[Ochrobactrum] teleogrylli]
MKKTFILGLLSIVVTHTAAADTSTLPTFPPRVSKQDFVTYMAGAMAAGLYCDGLDLNSEYIKGFQDATGLILPFAEPGYREEFARREKEAKEDPENYCKLAIVMFHKDVKPRAGLAPLLMNKTSKEESSHNDEAQ